MIPPIQYLTWMTGELLYAFDTPALLKVARANGKRVFTCWEVDHRDHNVIALTVQYIADEWRFVCADGSIRTRVHDNLGEPVDERLLSWTADFVSGLEPLRAVPADLDGWFDQPGDPLYLPLGFTTPHQHPDITRSAGTPYWMFLWCPPIVTSQIAPLPAADRAVYLEGMYNRLVWWTDRADLPREEREHQLDDLLHDRAPAAHALITQVHLAALDAQRR